MRRRHYVMASDADFNFIRKRHAQRARKDDRANEAGQVLMCPLTLTQEKEALPPTSSNGLYSPNSGGRTVPRQSKLWRQVNRCMIALFGLILVCIVKTVLSNRSCVCSLFIFKKTKRNRRGNILSWRVPQLRTKLTSQTIERWKPTLFWLSC